MAWGIKRENILDKKSLCVALNYELLEVYGKVYIIVDFVIACRIRTRIEHKSSNVLEDSVRGGVLWLPTSCHQFLQTWLVWASFLDLVHIACTTDQLKNEQHAQISYLWQDPQYFKHNLNSSGGAAISQTLIIWSTFIGHHGNIWQTTPLCIDASSHRIEHKLHI